MAEITLPIRFMHETDWNDLPEKVRKQARRCLIDAVGAGISGRSTFHSQIIHDFVASVYGGQGAFLWLDGREVTPPGAALASAMTIDASEMNDGHPPTKGHAGAAIIPTLLAMLPKNGAKIVSGQELLTTLVVGYEIALRAAIALQATASEFHSSGAWGAVGCAAVTARCLELTYEQTRHALGIAEYHGPRSLVMRIVDYPTMLKDGIGWGAMAGVSAALLARLNFTGAPAVTVEADEVEDIWKNLGHDWHITDLYFKPHAVCRWAQPAVEAAQRLQRKYGLTPDNIKKINVRTFHEATRLSCRKPQSIEEAQFSLPFTVAAILIHGKLGISETSGEALKNSTVLKLSDLIQLVEYDKYNALFPDRRFARVAIETKNGAIYDSDKMEAKWDNKNPPADMELREKFRWLTEENLPRKRAAELEKMLWHCDEMTNAGNLLELITAPVTS